MNGIVRVQITIHQPAKSLLCPVQGYNYIYIGLHPSFNPSTHQLLPLQEEKVNVGDSCRCGEMSQLVVSGEA